MKMKGYVALTAVLVMIPLLLITGIELVYRNITLLSIGKINYDWQILKIHSQTCLEESIYKISLDNDYIGEFIITEEYWSCTSNITDVSGEITQKIIDLEVSNTEGVSISLQKKIDTSYDPFELSNIE